MIKSIQNSHGPLARKGWHDLMHHLTPGILKTITDGVCREELPSAEITAITTDSRNITPGCLFAAIPGARVDGHDFIAAAREGGASCVLCNRPVDVDIPQIIVPDTQEALRSIAAYYRSTFDIPFVGITGSVGKTTAKEMIAAVLSAGFNTLKTEKNFNNELGVPLTLFRLREEHEAAVVEMGISGFGEMTRLAQMVRPGIAVYTLIGDSHLEFLGDRGGVLLAKGEMIAEMPEDGVVIVNGDDELLCCHDFGRRMVRFGLGENCDITASDISPDGLDGMKCVIHAGSRHIEARIPAFGRHMIYAALMGAAVGMELGLSDEQIAVGIASYETVGSRGRVIDTGHIRILDDCYNSNPTSCRAALDSLSMLPGRKVAILGDMLELGENAAALHREVGKYARKLGVEVIGCGKLSAECVSPDGVCFADTEELIGKIGGLIRPGDSVLVKASHGMHLETVVKALETLSMPGFQGIVVKE